MQDDGPSAGSDPAPDHDGDGDFRSDLRRGFGRRGVLAALAAGGAMSLWGLSRARALAEVTATGADGRLCRLLPEETAGPFPADGSNRQNGAVVNVLRQEGVLRQDLRTGFAGLEGRAEGVPLDLTIRLVNVDAACAPLAGRALYLWHCDAEGRYSIYNLPDTNYLRGLQISDSAGAMTFRTILPGCYQGRWPHLHFEVFTSPAAAVAGRDAQLTAQFALPRAACVASYADPRYGDSQARLAGQTFERDGIFGDNTPTQQAAQTLVMTGDPVSGYRADITVTLRG